MIVTVRLILHSSFRLVVRGDAGGIQVAELFCLPVPYQNNFTALVQSYQCAGTKISLRWN